MENKKHHGGAEHEAFLAWLANLQELELEVGRIADPAKLAVAACRTAREAGARLPFARDPQGFLTLLERLAPPADDDAKP